MNLSITKQMISLADFARIDFRIGTIVKAEKNEKAKNPSFKVGVDFGNNNIRWSSAQLPYNYKMDDLFKKQVLAVNNFPSRKIGGFKSEILIVGFPDEQEHVALLNTRGETVSNGLQLSFGQGDNKSEIVYDDFAKAEIRSATIVELNQLESDSESYSVVLDVGKCGKVKTTLVDVKKDQIEKLLNSQVAVVINIKKECFTDLDTHVLCFTHNKSNVPFGVDKVKLSVHNGGELF